MNSGTPTKDCALNPLVLNAAKTANRQRFM
jgi:hypothetical protein